MSANRPYAVRAVAPSDDLIAGLENMLASSGSASHAFARQIAEPGPLPRMTIADVLHHLSLLHGKRPSMFEIVAQSPLAPAGEWMNAAMRSFAQERDLLARLVVAAGPPPSRLGQTNVEEAVKGTRNALVTLAGSDRLGCAVGAAAALLLDWEAISAALRRMAARLDFNAGDRHPRWPGRTETIEVIRTAASLPGGERAVTFGFQTLLAQHASFWNIVQTRAA